MGSIITGIIFFVMGFVFTISASTSGYEENMGLGMLGGMLEIISIILIICGIVKRTKAKKRKKIVQLEKDEKGFIEKTQLKHVVGLPIPESAECTLFLYPDKIAIDRNGTAYNLAFSKISDVVIKTDVEIRNSYSSSVGGAVGGAVLFGPLGAMVGGRRKKTTDTAVTKYLILSYEDDKETKFISFDCSYNFTADKFVNFFNSLPKQQKEINL